MTALTPLQDILAQRPESSVLKLKATAYDRSEGRQFLIDVMALANADAAGDRRIVIGATGAMPDQRRILGVEPEALRRLESALPLIHEYLEPLIVAELVVETIDDKQVAALSLQRCDNPPYMLKSDFNETLPVGDCWIRDGVRELRVKRTDLDRMYRQKLARSKASTPIRLGFAGNKPVAALALVAPVLGPLPSLLAAAKLREAISAKLTLNSLGQDDTFMDRLNHAHFYGSDAPYNPQGVDTMTENLAGVDEAFEAADSHFLYELNAHKVNFVLLHRGDTALKDAVLSLDIPNAKGLTVADRVYPAPAASAESRALLEGYPRIERLQGATRIHQLLGSVKAGARMGVFRQPLRIALDPDLPMAALDLSYTLRAENLTEAITGKLRVSIKPAASGSEDTNLTDAINVLLREA